MQKKIIPGLIALAVVGGLAGCSPAGPVVKEKPAAETVEETTAAAPEPEPEPEPEEAGTRSNPAAPGTPAKHSSDSVWTFTVSETDGDAWPEISATNQFNEAPGEGNAFIMVPVHVALDDTEQTAEGADPMWSFGVEYVTASGNSYDGTDCGVLPEPGELFQIGTMYGGAEADFLACAKVPAADVAGGTWRVYSQVDGSSAVFFTGA